MGIKVFLYGAIDEITITSYLLGVHYFYDAIMFSSL